MIAVRRTVTVLVLTLVVVLGGSLAASAAFGDTAALGRISASTSTVSAPSDVTATEGSCSQDRLLEVTVAWQPSTSTRISGYEIKAYRDDGLTFTVATTGPGTTSISGTADKKDGAVTSYTFTVTTLTSYGWSSPESLPSGAVTC